MLERSSASAASRSSVTSVNETTIVYGGSRSVSTACVETASQRVSPRRRRSPATTDTCGAPVVAVMNSGVSRVGSGWPSASMNDHSACP